MNGKRIKQLTAVFLALTLLAGGCARGEPESSAGPGTDQSLPAEAADPAVEAERLAILKEAGEKRNSCLWPRETVQKDILGQKIEFVLYHGNGWTIHVPASWVGEAVYAGLWSSPSHNAGFGVSKQYLGVNNPKWYRAQMGSWRHETDYAPPFDYYYDNDGGYTPPEGSADYIYFFAPDGEDRSYEFTLSSVVGKNTEEERAIQEAMLLSFRLDESSHVLYSEDYRPGLTEWEAAMAGLVSESEPVQFFWVQDGTAYNVDGKGSPDYLTHALAVADCQPGEFVQTFFGERPEGVPAMGEDMITLLLPEMGIWLYFDTGSPWVCLHHAGEDYWAELRHPGEIFDIVRDWRDAERGWASGSAES